MFSARSLWGVVAVILVAKGMVPISVSFSAPPTADRIDLGTKAGVAKVKGQWRFANVKIVEVPGLNPSTTTYDIDPKAQSANFDDSQWELVDPTTLGQALDRQGVLLLVPHQDHRTARVGREEG